MINRNFLRSFSERLILDSINIESILSAGNRIMLLLDSFERQFQQSTKTNINKIIIIDQVYQK